MEHVFIARHGDYTKEDNKLTPQGIEQITGLAKQIKLILADQSNPLILTSQSQRAMESSEILKVTLGARVPEQCPYINNNFLTDADIAKIDEWVDRAASRPEPLILVTHVPVLERYVPHFAVKYLGRSQGEKWEVLPKGGAYHFDLIAKTVQKLPNTNFLLPNRQSRQSLDSRVIEGNENEDEDEKTINAALQLASQERVFLTDSDWALLRDKEYQPATPSEQTTRPQPFQPIERPAATSLPSQSSAQPAQPIGQLAIPLVESRPAQQPEQSISPIAPTLSQSVPVYSIVRHTPLKKTVYQFVLLADAPFDKKHFVSLLRKNLGEKDAIDETKHNYLYRSGVHDATLSFMTVMDPQRQTLLVSSHNSYAINATKALIDKAIGSQKPKS